MRKMTKVFIYLFISVLILAVFGLFATRFVPSNNSAASSDDCIAFDDTVVRDYLSNNKGMTIKDIHEINRITISGVNNYSQRDLNVEYNRHSTNRINDTCTIVAVTTMLDYYGNFLNEFELDDTEDCFRNVYDACLEKGLTTINEGTPKTNTGWCLKTGFEDYNSTRGVAADWWNPIGDINNAVSANYPIIFDLTDHSIVICGKVEYQVVYEYTYWSGFLWWGSNVTETETKVEEFAIVCEGWGIESRSLVWYNKITNYFNGGMQAIWATGREA